MATTDGDDAEDPQIVETVNFGDYEIVEPVYPIVPRDITDEEYTAASEYLAFVAKCESTQRPSLIFTHLCRLMGAVAWYRASEERGRDE
jgi:hypothetical protein